MREHGRIIVNDPDSDQAALEMSTYQCCHCGGHFESKPDLMLKLVAALQQGGLTREQAKQARGKVRGWCMNCNAPICGPDCAECVPTDLLLENMERGRPLNFKPIIVSTSGTVIPE